MSSIASEKVYSQLRPEQMQLIDEVFEFETFFKALNPIRKAVAVWFINLLGSRLPDPLR